MAELQERYRHFEDRSGLVPVGTVPIRAALRGIRRSLPTMRHARRVFDLVRDALGPRAFCEGHRAHGFALFLRDDADPEWICVVPLLELLLIQRDFVMATWQNADPLRAEDAPDAPAPLPSAESDGPDIVPQGDEMTSGTLVFQEGRSSFELRYDARGVLRETGGTMGDSFILGRYPARRPFTADPLARPPVVGPPSILCQPELEDGYTPEALAAIIVRAAQPPSTARVRVPAPIPGGVRAAWMLALQGLREEAFAGSFGNGEGFVVVDGFAGTARALGPDRRAALDRWNAALFRERPKPPKEPVPSPPPPLEPDAPRDEPLRADDGKLTRHSLGTFTLRIESRIPPIPWPAAIPSNTPAALVELSAAPEVPEALRGIGFARVVRLIAGDGQVRHGFVRDEENGFVVVGEGVLDLIDPATFDEELETAEERQRDEAASFAAVVSPWIEFRWSVARYTLFDDSRRARIPLEHVGGQFCDEPIGSQALDGAVDPWRVVRVRERARIRA
ncbi:MAG: hypothetical protein JNL21_32205 [Myxococcales bacterium]|nr:hypothetical protein [Myxococcales bacterium]